MSDFPNDRPRFLAGFSLDGWAVSIATAFAVLIILGVVPRVLW